MDKRLKDADLLNNPAALIAAIHYMLEREGQDDQRDDAVQHVALLPGRLVPPALGREPRQAVRADGKKNVFAGQTPIKALGTTDQHSQVQLYREGPNDKIITFLEVERFGNKLTIPSSMKDVRDAGVPGRRPIFRR